MKNNLLTKFNRSIQPLRFLPTVVVFVFVIGCATPVHTDFKPDTPFASYRTFALLPLPQTAPANDPGLMLRLATPAQEAVTEALTAKGFQAAAREKADFAVNLSGSSLPKVEVTDWGYDRSVWVRRHGYVPVHVGEVDVRTYDERTLSVEIFDNKSHELVWVGRMKKKTSGGTVKPEKLKEAIHSIIAKFPPPATRTTR